MSDAKAASPTAALPGSERPDYRGKCLYKTGKCVKERALKTSGVAHNLCDEHRNRQNRHQRKLDAKNRLHKQERRISTKAVKGERFSPYGSKRESIATSVAVSVDVESGDNAVVSPVTSPAAAAVATCADATSLASTTQSPVLATSGRCVMFMPKGSQSPQVAYPFVMQDFDGIVVPLPSYLEGTERIEFRSRIYQKVLDFISEECILRFGAKVNSASVDDLAATRAAPTTQRSSSGLKAESRANSEASSDDHLLAAGTSDASRACHQ